MRTLGCSKPQRQNPPGTAGNASRYDALLTDYDAVVTNDSAAVFEAWRAELVAVTRTV